MTNPETLAKMEYLHECGFVPDMWSWDYDNNSKLVLHSSKLSEDRQPYFTESALWSLLPKKITVYKKDEGYGYLAINGALILGYFGTWSTKGFEVDIKETTLHSALLDLTIWAVKEGYLKVKENV